jgi:CheY-like chemotaxis protein
MAYKLLLADDSQTIQKVVELVLNPVGFDIMAYDNGQVAMKALESVMPDIVLADIEMPELNGYQLCEKIKGNPATLHVPVILLAGAFEPFDEDYAKSVGADDFILKPFESHELISKVKSLIIQHETLGMPVRAGEEKVTAESFRMAGVERAAAVPIQETEWAESFTFDKEEEFALPPEKDVMVSLSPGAKAFDEELMESLQTIENESKESFGVMTAGTPKEISIDEISKMVKEAMAEPMSSVTEEGPSALPGKIAPVGIPDVRTATVDDLVRDSVRYQTGDLKSVIDSAVREKVEEILPSVIRDSVERAVSETVPNLLEEALRESLKEIAVFLHGAINDEIKKIVPGVAESVIRREIEKITSELT